MTSQSTDDGRFAHKDNAIITDVVRTELSDALEIAAMCNPIRCYEGALWFGRNQNFADATFVDHGAARAFVNIVNAAPDLVKALEAARKWLVINDDPRCQTDLKTLEAVISSSEGGA